MRPNARAWRLSAAALLIATAISPALAADKPCGEAGKAIDGVTSWPALQKAVRDYGHCDKGPTAETFTEAVLRVYISGWPTMGAVGPILEKDAAFKTWLNRRLSSPDLAVQDSAEMRDLAKSSCPKGQDKLCAELVSTIEMGRAMSAPELMQIAPAAPAPAKKP